MSSFGHTHHDPASHLMGGVTPPPGDEQAISLRQDPRFALLMAVSFIVAAALVSPAAWYAFAGLFLVWLAACRASGVSAWHAGWRVRWPMLISLIGALPVPYFASRHLPADMTLAGWPVASAGLWLALRVAAVSILALLASSLLARCHPLARIAAALRSLGAPAFLVSLFAFTGRSIESLLDVAGQMSRARAARLYHGRWLWQVASTGHLAGTLLLRSIDRSERVHRAMLARGFDGLSFGSELEAMPGGGRLRTVIAVAAVMLVPLAAALMESAKHA